MPLPVDLRLALSPFDTYRELVAESVPGSWRRALERPLLIATMVGTTMTMASVRRVALGVIVLNMISWSFVVLFQLAIGAITVRLARRRPLTVARSVELLFVGHLPWSVWMLLMAFMYAFTPFSPGRTGQLATLITPALWTTLIVFAFCRDGLGCTPPRAWLFTLLHQAMTWTVFVGYAFLTSGIWGRVLAALGA